MTQPGSRSSALRRGLSLLLAALLGGADCSYPPRVGRRLVRPEELATLDKRSAYLKAHLRDGRAYVLSSWTVDEASRTVSGQGELLGLDRRIVTETGRFTLPVDSVALFETNVVPPSKVLAGRTLLVGVSTALTLGCVLMPKACFGSCPTFYVGDGEGASLAAEGFSGSVSPAREHSDLDALYRARPRNRRFEVRMTNEALETHVVRHVRLLAARRPPGGRVVATQSEELREVTALGEPSSCQAEEGDCRAAVKAFDGVERTSRTDGRDLATRETIDLRFAPRSREPLGLVIGSRQTLLTTYLFYQALAYMGRSAGDWLARLETSGSAELVDRVHDLNDVLGGIEVLMRGPEGDWVPAGEIRETGPLASDVKVVPLPAIDGPVDLRLRLTRGHWRIDLLALGSLGAPVTPVRLTAEEVHGHDGPFTRRSGVPRTTSAASRTTSTPLTTLPGDAYRFVFQLPADPQGLDLFLESRGYYLEWIRQEWLAEEDPAAVLRMLWSPRRSLVDLAPAFKEKEAAMEDAFWRSRYGAAR